MSTSLQERPLMSLLALFTAAGPDRTTHARSRRNVRQRRSMPRVECLESLQLLSGFSGVKFEDLNANGKRDGGETGLAGWQIRAFNDLNGNGLIDTNEAGSDNVADSDTTDSNGAYSLSLAPGKYVVVETTKGKEGWTQSYPNNDV